jgi:hypothetical protein
MWFGLKNIDVWRDVPVTTSGNWEDAGAIYGPNYQYHHTISGCTYMPFSSIEGVRNEQKFANITSQIFVKNNPNVTEDDELVIPSGIYERISIIERYDCGLVPHWRLYTTTSQWDRQ